jgi:membrane-bound lytic murein transglycosylase A
MTARLAFSLALLLALSACGGRLIPPSATSRPPERAPATETAKPPVAATPVAPTPVPAVAASANALKAGVVAGPALSTLGLTDDNARRALAAFRTSCPSLQRRTDASGLTRAGDWSAVCAEAGRASDARAFFEDNFELAQVGDGKSLATGYYEPEIEGARQRSAKYAVPIYRRPPDLVEVELGLFSDDLKGKRIRGRVEGQRFVPYPDRTAIEEGALVGRGLEIAWAADPVEFFFLQVQGSGRLRLPDGGIMRIGYDNQNGRDYTGIGRLMRERGLLQPGQTSMQGIMAWLRANPEEGRKIMRENKSWVFFRELTGPGPLGALGLPVVARVSVAADPAFVPLGAPAFLSMDRADATGLWVAQDTGGAIKGSNRFDTFWGAGADARATAGGMSARGTAFVLLPKGVLARIQADPGNGTPAP